jgi:hypothetical protein
MDQGSDRRSKHHHSLTRGTDTVPNQIYRCRWQSLCNFMPQTFFSFFFIPSCEK